MNKLVEILAQNLVDKPDEVEVSIEENGDLVQIKLRVAPDDMGKVIGKQGRTAKALRALVKAGAAKKNKRANLEIV